MAQYSAPFSVALAFYRDPRDPKVFVTRRSAILRSERCAAG